MQQKRQIQSPETQQLGISGPGLNLSVPRQGIQEEDSKCTWNDLPPRVFKTIYPCFNTQEKNIYCNIKPFDIQSIQPLSLMQCQKKKIFNQGWVYIIRSEYFIRLFHYYVNQVKLSKPIIAGVDFSYQFTEQERVQDANCINNPSYVTFSIYDSIYNEVGIKMMKEFIKYKRNKIEHKKENDKNLFGIDLVQYPGQFSYYLHEAFQDRNRPGAYDIGNSNTITLIIDIQCVIERIQMPGPQTQLRPILNSEILENWWNQPCFNSLFGRAYYKVCYHNPGLRNTPNNKFYQFICDSTASDSIYWFDLNQYGAPFVNGQNRPQNINDLIKYLSAREYIEEIDPDRSLRNDNPKLDQIFQHIDPNFKIADMYDLSYQYTTDEILYYTNERQLQLASLLYDLEIPYTIPPSMERQIQVEHAKLGAINSVEQTFGYVNDTTCQRTSFVMPVSVYVPTRAHGNPMLGDISQIEALQFSQQTVTLLTLFTSIVFQNPSVLCGLLLGSHLKVLKSLSNRKESQHQPKAWDPPAETHKEQNLISTINLVEDLLLRDTTITKSEIIQQYIEQKQNSYVFFSDQGDEASAEKAQFLMYLAIGYRDGCSNIGKQIRGGMLNLYNAHYKQVKQSSLVEGKYKQKLSSYQGNSVFQDRYMKRIVKSLDKFYIKAYRYWGGKQDALQKEIYLHNHILEVPPKVEYQSFENTTGGASPYIHKVNEHYANLEELVWNNSQAFPITPVGLRDFYQDPPISDLKHPQVKFCFNECIKRKYFKNHLDFQMVQMNRLRGTCKSFNVDPIAIQTLFYKFVAPFPEIPRDTEDFQKRQLLEYHRTNRAIQYTFKIMPEETQEEKDARHIFMQSQNIDDAWIFDKLGVVQDRRRNPKHNPDYLVEDQPIEQSMGSKTFTIKWPAAQYGFWPLWNRDVYRVTAYRDDWIVFYNPTSAPSSNVIICVHKGRYEYTKKGQRCKGENYKKKADFHNGFHQMYDLSNNTNNINTYYKVGHVKIELSNISQILASMASEDFNFQQDRWAALQELNLNDGHRINMIFRANAIKWLQLVGITGVFCHLQNSCKEPLASHFGKVLESIKQKFLEKCLKYFEEKRDQQLSDLPEKLYSKARQVLFANKHLFNTDESILELSERFTYFNAHANSRIPVQIFNNICLQSWYIMTDIVKDQLNSLVINEVIPSIQRNEDIYSDAMPLKITNEVYDMVIDAMNQKAQKLIHSFDDLLQAGGDDWTRINEFHPNRLTGDLASKLFTDCMGRWVMKSLCRQELKSETVRKINKKYKREYFDRGSLLAWAIIDDRCLEPNALTLEENFKKQYQIQKYDQQLVIKEAFRGCVRATEESGDYPFDDDIIDLQDSYKMIPDQRLQPTYQEDNFTEDDMISNNFEGAWAAATSPEPQQLPGTWGDDQPQQNVFDRNENIRRFRSLMQRSRMISQGIFTSVPLNLSQQIGLDVMYLDESGLQKSVFGDDYLELGSRKVVKNRRINY